MKPNIVLILADDMGYGDVGCFNPESKIPTPRMDRLAREGVKFSRMYAPSSVCCPTRYGIMTGRYCWRTSLKRGVLYGYDHPLISPERPTLGSLLKSSGYDTYYVGKWHLGLTWRTREGTPGKWPDGLRDGAADIETQLDFASPFAGGPLDLGFDYFFGLSESLAGPPYCFLENDRTVGIPTILKPDRSDAIGVTLGGRQGMMVEGWRHEDVGPTLTRKALECVRSHVAKKKEPFFLYLALSAPHLPCDPPDFVKGRSAAGRRGDMVCEVDWSVGEVADLLAELDLENDTLLIAASDNGAVPGDMLLSVQDPHFGIGDLRDVPIWTGPSRVPSETYGHKSNGDFRDYKTSIWDGGLRVPFIARWTGTIEPGSRVETLACLSDIPATVAELLGVSAGENALEDSVSFLPSLLGSASGKTARSPLVLLDYFGRYSIRHDDWKLVRFETLQDEEYTRRHPAPPPQLYRLSEDLSESRDLAAAYPKVVKKLDDLLEQIKREGRSAI